MMGEQFQVNAADLVAHAGQVDGIGDGLATAQRAGQAVRTDAGAYGQLCQFVPALLNGLQQQLIDGIATAARAAHDTADSLRAVAADYSSADGSAADRLSNTR
jgi:hypothetical protein